MLLPERDGVDDPAESGQLILRETLKEQTHLDAPLLAPDKSPDPLPPLLPFLRLLFFGAPARESSCACPLVVMGMSESAAVGGLSAPLNEGGDEGEREKRRGEGKGGDARSLRLSLPDTTFLALVRHSRRYDAW
jgi:hypothetical protein